MLVGCPIFWFEQPAISEIKEILKFSYTINRIFKHMPTVLRNGPYKFFFYSNNGDEPQHVHISRDNKIAKFWIDPVRLQVSGGFSRHELLKI